MLVKLGAHDLTKNEDTIQKFSVVKVTINEGYSGESPEPPFIHDIAVLELSDTPILNEYVAYAPLSKNIDWNEKSGSKAIVAGWGLTENFGSTSDELKEAQVTLFSAKKCVENRYPKRFPVESFICTLLSTDDSCRVRIRIRMSMVMIIHTCPCILQGDSGGPLHCPIDNPNDYDYETKVQLDKSETKDYSVCGIVSFGKQGGCGDTSELATGRSPTYPVYTNIAYYTDWINSVTSGEFPKRIRLITTGKPLQNQQSLGVGGTYILQDDKHNDKPYYVHRSGQWSISWRKGTKSWNIGGKSANIDAGRDVGYIIGPSNDNNPPHKIKFGWNYWNYSEHGWQDAAENEVRFEVISSS